MLISFIKPNSVSPDGSYIQSCGKEKAGTSLIKVKLDDILNGCNQIEKAKAKHQNGSIFAYIDDTLGLKDDQMTDGVLFVEFDELDKEVAEKIFENFETLTLYCNSLYAVQYSSSYYLKEKGGLHFYFKTKQLDKNEYKNTNLWCTAVLIQSIKKSLAITVEADTHMKSFAQRFFLYHSEFKKNEFAVEFDLNAYSKFKKQFIENYPFLNETFNTYNNYEYDEIRADKYCSGNVDVKICIDRNFSIGNYSGNDVRWRISRIASELFRENAREWCNKYFYYENGKSIYSKVREDIPISGVVFDWLKEHKYIIDNNDKRHLKKNEYITKCEEDIYDFIKEKRTQVVAPTGAGKTVLINSLAKRLNAVVIVPFNVTNKLYSELNVVSSENDNIVTWNKPCVMIWDQAVIHWSEIKDRHIIVDESHTLFTDRNYRRSAISIINKLKESNYITLFTATPLIESELIGCTESLEYSKERNSVFVRFIHTEDNIDWRQYAYIKRAVRENWFDKIVLFDDKSAKKIYERLIANCDILPSEIAYIRSETKESEDFERLRDEEMLTKKLTICTCIAFNGLNFKNENENILVVSRFTSNNTLYSELVQELGRIRKSNVKGLIFCEEGDVENLEEYRDKAEIKRDAIANNSPQCRLVIYNDELLDNEYYNTLVEIRDYKRIHSNIDEVKRMMNGYKYFKIKEEYETKDKPFNARMILSMKKKESDEFKSEFKTKELEDFERENKKYSVEFCKKLNGILYDADCKLNENDIQRIFELRKKDTLVDTILDDVIDMKNVALMTRVEWKQYSDTIKEITTNYIKKDYNIINIKSKYNQLKDLHNRFVDSGIVVEDYSDKEDGDIFDMFCSKIMFGRKVDVDKVNGVYFKYLDDRMNNRKCKNSEGGKNGGKVSKKNNMKKVIYDGVVYDSAKELSEKIQKPAQTITRWIKNGKVLVVK